VLFYVPLHPQATFITVWLSGHRAIQIFSDAGCQRLRKTRRVI
jgi:hypothetical protein